MNASDVLSLPKSFDKYEVITEIGSGGYATVVLARHLQTKELYACKILERKRFTDNVQIQRLEAELRVVERISHPRIAKVYKILYLEDFIIVVMEYCPNGSLFDILSNYTYLTEREAKGYIIDVLEALTYLHSQGISHRDIKLDNIVISQDYHAKIVDFGMGSFLNVNTTLCGTLEFIPPEIIRKKKYDPKCADMWSLGVCAYTLLTGRFPWSGGVVNKRKQILACQYEIPNHISDLMKKVIKTTITYNPSDRATASQILEELKKSVNTLPSLQNKTCKKLTTAPNPRVLSWKPRAFKLQHSIMNTNYKQSSIL